MKIVVFGNSIAWWAFDTQYGWWVERLKLFYLQDYVATQTQVYNCSVSGNFSADILSYMEHDIQKIVDERDDLIIVFATGTNDASCYDNAHSPVVPIDVFQQHMQACLACAQKYTSRIMVVWLTSVDETVCNPYKWDLWYLNANLEKYTHVLHDVATAYGAIYIDLWDVLTQQDLSDGLHPNAWWHEKIFAKVHTYLRKLVLS